MTLLWWRSWCLKVFRHNSGSIDRHGVFSPQETAVKETAPTSPPAGELLFGCSFEKASWKQLLIQNSDPMMKLFGFKLPTCFWAGFKRMQIVEDSESEELCFAPNLDRDNLTLSLTRFPSTWCFHHFDSCNPVHKRLWVSICFHDVNAIWTLIRSSCTFLFRQEFLPARARMKLLPNQRRRKLRQRVNFLGRLNGLSGVNEKTT